MEAIIAYFSKNPPAQTLAEYFSMTKICKLQQSSTMHKRLVCKELLKYIVKSLSYMQKVPCRNAQNLFSNETEEQKKSVKVMTLHGTQVTFLYLYTKRIRNS